MKEKKGEHPRGDAGQIILFFVFLIVWIWDSFFFRFSTFLSDYIPLSIRLIFLGLAAIAAAYLFGTGHIAVSDPQRPSHVITHGAFRYVRHPLYLGGILIYLGMVISTASLLSLGILVLISCFYNFIATFEEKLMEMRFGEEYRIYKEKTGKWMPKLSRK